MSPSLQITAEHENQATLKMSEQHSGYHDYRMAVPTAFEQVFSHFYFAENRSARSITKTLLPSYQTILIFNFGTKISLQSAQNMQISMDKCIVLGPIKRAFDYSMPTGAEMLVVNFKDDAFYRFFGNAAIAEHLPIDPDGLLQQDCFIGLWKTLDTLTDNTERITNILRFCEPYLQHRNKIAEQLASFDSQLQSPIKAVSTMNNQTERNTQLNYKKHFGYTAKEFNRYSRFLKAVRMIPELLKRNSKPDWFELINACGYYDQSQLIRDFKHYTNLSPTRYLKFQRDICG